MPLVPGKITKAVIPMAGQGTRLRPLTRVVPKEMLPLGRKPSLEYVLEELHLVGVNCIILVVSPSKSAVRDYFGDTACGGEVALKYVVQDTQKGLADAVLRAEEEVGGDRFIVALGDTVVVSRRDDIPLARLISACAEHGAGAGTIVERVPIQDAHMYGMVRPVGSTSGEAFEITGLVEKPNVEASPSDFAIGGRYIFGPDIFDRIRRTPPGAGGEQQITDSIGLTIAGGERVWCVPIQEGEYRFDIGSFKTYCEAFTTVCMLDKELAPLVRKASRIGW